MLMQNTLAVDTLCIDVNAECIDVNECCVDWLLTLFVLLEDALHIDLDSVRNSYCDCVYWLLIDATKNDF